MLSGHPSELPYEENAPYFDFSGYHAISKSFNFDYLCPPPTTLNAKRLLLRHNHCPDITNKKHEERALKVSLQLSIANYYQITTAIIKNIISPKGHNISMFKLYSIRPIRPGHFFVNHNQTRPQCNPSEERRPCNSK